MHVSVFLSFFLSPGLCFFAGLFLKLKQTKKIVFHCIFWLLIFWCLSFDLLSYFQKLKETKKIFFHCNLIVVLFFVCQQIYFLRFAGMLLKLKQTKKMFFIAIFDCLLLVVCHLIYFFTFKKSKKQKLFPLQFNCSVIFCLPTDLFSSFC